MQLEGKVTATKNTIFSMSLKKESCGSFASILPRSLLLRTQDTSCSVRSVATSSVRLSCTTALDILNDLLTFEKLDSGILELHKEELSAAEFIADCVRMFGAQAKARDVILILQPFCPDPASAIGNGNGLADAGAVSLESHDTISLDKFKIAQVVRNLISNALKFTPAGGSVTVTPSFIPCAKDCNVRPSSESRVNKKLWCSLLKCRNRGTTICP
jgi:signal transduction histidine kinase